MVGVIFVYVDKVFGFYGYSFLCFVECFSMIIWTPAVLSVLYACVLYFCFCTCSAQLSMFRMERPSRNTLIIIIVTTVCLDRDNQEGFVMPRNFMSADCPPLS